MTRMAEERDSILRIRAKVDNFDEWQESQDATPSTTPDNPPDCRVSLCSPGKPVRVYNISATLAQEFGLSNFANRLAKFLHIYGGRKVSLQRLEACSVCQILIVAGQKTHLPIPDMSVQLHADQLCVHDECRTQE
jgi:hypothetical protein